MLIPILVAVSLVLVIVLYGLWRLSAIESHHEIEPVSEDHAIMEVRGAIEDLDDYPESGETCRRIVSLARHSTECARFAYNEVLELLKRHDVEHLTFLARDLGRLYREKASGHPVTEADERAIQQEVAQHGGTVA